MAKKICGVYKITNMANGKIYIGSSNNVERRWYDHKRSLTLGEHGNKHLQSAWNKYGERSFTFDLIEQCDPVAQFEREQFYLNELDPFDDNGYNIVRQISQEYMSGNYMVKKCTVCGHDYSTFSHLSKYCDKCREETREITKDWWKYWVNEKITVDDIMSWGYEDWDDFCESNL